MTRPLKLLACLASALVLHGTARAAVPEARANPYQVIPASNVFRLQPIMLRNQDATPIALLKITLAGISTFERKCVLLKVRAPAGLGEQAKEWSCILGEGQRAGPVEVLEIDPETGSARVNNSGTIVVLTFEKDGPVLRNAQPPLEPPSVAHPERH